MKCPTCKRRIRVSFGTSGLVMLEHTACYIKRRLRECASGQCDCEEER